MKFFLLISFLLFAQCADSSSPSETTSSAAAETLWTCSMHPQFQLPEPVPCPICFMGLIPVNTSAADLGPRTLSMTEEAIALAEIKTAPARRRPITHEIRLLGEIAFDESKQMEVTTWTGGRIDQLHLNYTGMPVQRGDALATLWNPTLQMAQEELLQALRSAKSLKDSTSTSLQKTAVANVEAAKSRLLNLGMPKESLQGFLKAGVVSAQAILRAPAQGVVQKLHVTEGEWVKPGNPVVLISSIETLWMIMDAYEKDLPWLQEGQTVKFEAEALPGESFEGRLAFIPPTVETNSRTLAIRVNVSNPDGKLKPGMAVKAAVQAPYSLQQVPLVIPDSAPLITGRRAVVYVRKPDTVKPAFEGRVVTLGPKTGGWYVVKDGLQEGEIVVVQGAFRIDASLQILAKSSMMSQKNEDLAPSLLADKELKKLGDLADLSLSMQEALAADDAGSAPEFARLSYQILQNWITWDVEDDLARKKFAEIRSRLLPIYGRLSATQGIEQQRVEFDLISKELIPLLDAFGYIHDGEPLRVMHCPMAFEDRGAEWLQGPGRLANPYFGSSMLRCGTVRRTISAR